MLKVLVVDRPSDQPSIRADALCDLIDLRVSHLSVILIVVDKDVLNAPFEQVISMREYVTSTVLETGLNPKIVS